MQLDSGLRILGTLYCNYLCCPQFHLIFIFFILPRGYCLILPASIGLQLLLRQSFFFVLFILNRLNVLLFIVVFFYSWSSVDLNRFPDWRFIVVIDVIVSRFVRSFSPPGVCLLLPSLVIHSQLRFFACYFFRRVAVITKLSSFSVRHSQRISLLGWFPCTLGYLVVI